MPTEKVHLDFLKKERLPDRQHLDFREDSPSPGLKSDSAESNNSKHICCLQCCCWKEPLPEVIPDATEKQVSLRRPKEDSCLSWCRCFSFCGETPSERFAYSRRFSQVSDEVPKWIDVQSPSIPVNLQIGVIQTKPERPLTANTPIRTAPLLYRPSTGASEWNEADANFSSQRTLLSSNEEEKTWQIRHNDPFLQRDLDEELRETLQAFNLLLYGEPAAKFLIDQLKKQQKSAYWRILCMLMNALVLFIPC